MKEYFNIFNYYKEHKRVNSFTREQLLNFQLEKFRRVLKHALAVSPFYRDLYSNSGILIQDVDNIKPQDCPLTNKKMLMENFDQVVADPSLKYEKVNQFVEKNHNFHDMFENKYWITHTSGSTGFAGIYPYSLEEFLFIKTFYAEFILKASPLDLLSQLGHRKKMMFFGAIHGHFAGVTLAASVPSAFYEQHSYSFLEPMDKIIADINDYQPDMIMGYASSIRQLAEAQLEGLLHINPKEIFSSGDAMYAASREVIRKAFGVNPRNLYSSTEAPVLAWQANDDSEDMYVSDNLYHLDLVDDKVCVSGLYQYTFPKIRYQMEDSIEFIESDKLLPFSKIKLKNARVFDTIEVVNNQGQTVILPSLAFRLLHVEGVEQYQFWKMPNNTILVKAKGKGDHFDEELREEVLLILRQRNADKVVHIDIEHVDYIPVDEKTGKFKLINIA